MIRRVRERRSDEDLSAITLNPSSVLMSGEDVRGRESASRPGREPAEGTATSRDVRSSGPKPAHVGDNLWSVVLIIRLEIWGQTPPLAPGVIRNITAVPVDEL